MRNLLLAAAVLLLMTGAAYADKAPSFNRKGIAAYKAHRFDESVQRFTDALVERPQSPELRFNRGTALSALGKMDEAVGELENAANAFKDRKTMAAARFNAGNALFRAEDYAGAVNQYRRAVKLDQTSKDIRRNLELALRKLQNQQKDNDQKKDKDNQKDKKDKNDKNKQDQKKQKREKQEQKQQRNLETRPMTKEEADRLLNAVNDEEKKALSLRNEQMKASIQQGNDW